MNSGSVTNYGGYFQAEGSSGRGVYGIASNSGPVTNYGGYFVAEGSSGYGVISYAAGITGIGVHGNAWNTEGVNNVGGSFEARGSEGYGVSGVASNTGNYTNYGGYFQAAGELGRGVYGYAEHDSGANKGVFGKTDSPNGYAGYFEGRGYFSDNVGIGTDNPDEMLHIAGNMRLDGTFEDKDGQAGSAGQILSSTGTGTDWIAVSSGGGDFSNGGEAGGANRTLGNNDNYALSLKTNNSSRLKIQNDGGIRIDGNVGMFMDPIAGTNRNLQIFASATYSNPYIKLSGHNSGNIYLESRRSGFTPETSGKVWTLASGSGSVLDLDKFIISNPDDGVCFAIRDGGNVGIGTQSPDEKLHIAGNMRLDGTFEDKDGNAGSAGQILSSTATGTDWIAAPSGGTDTDWTISGDDMYSAVSGNVGVGKIPLKKLDVDGDINSDGIYNMNNAPFLSYTGGLLKSTFLGYDAGHGTFGYKNTFIGYEAGKSGGAIYGTFVGYRAGTNTAQYNNTFIGYLAGETNTTGAANVFIGAQAGLANTTANNNTFVGAFAGMDNEGGRNNVFIGTQSGSNNVAGIQNTFLGFNSGLSNTNGSNNVFIGHHAGETNNLQSGNVYIGFQAGKNSDANFNTFIGYNAGENNSSGNKNTYYGYQAGRLNEIGVGNVFLGHLAGYPELGSDKLYIDNTNTSTPLIYGDFSTNDVIINGNLEVTVKMQANGGFNINGTDGISGTFSFYNDGTTTGQVQSITVNGGIITSVLTIP